MTATRIPLLLAVFLMQAVAEKALVPLLDFAGPEAADRWQAVNDGVMGGVADGRFKITEEKTLEFFGTLSLENNGGFASVRTTPTDLDIKAGDTLAVRVKGDGREYVLNIYTTSRRMAFSYRAPLPTTKDEWREVEIPLAEFIPTGFRRRVHGMGRVEPDQSPKGLPVARRRRVESVEVIKRHRRTGTIGTRHTRDNRHHPKHRKCSYSNPVCYLAT